MNVQLQCVYGGKRNKHSVFRGQELRTRRRRVVKYVILVLITIAVFFGAYFGAEALLNEHAQASSTQQAITLPASASASANHSGASSGS